MTAPNDYFTHSRPEVVRLVEGQGCRVLELGCGAGVLGAELRARGVAAVLHGLEREPTAAAEAARTFDRVWPSDLDDVDLAETTEPPYDVVVAADVIEHVRDPWRLTDQIHRVLRPGGQLVASVPNIRHLRFLCDLALRGRFEYTDEGLLDRTHLRFFTRSSVVSLLTGAGFDIELMEGRVPVGRSLPRSIVTRVLGDLAHPGFLIDARRTA